MEKGFLRQSILIEDLEAYAGFFNSEWADREIKRARSTPFGEPLFHLLYAWRGASYVRQMPLMANNAVASSVDVALRAFPEHFVKPLATLKDRIVLTTSQEPLTQSQIRLIEKD